MRIQLYLCAIAIVITTSVTFTACNNDTICTAEEPKGPVVVTIDCADDARADDEQLGNKPIVIEYQYDDERWESCRYVDVFDIAHRLGQYEEPEYYNGDYSNFPLTAQLCGDNKNLRATAQCGIKPGGTFYVRALQGNRSAGPMEVTGERRKGKCESYTDKSLSYELSLDVEE